MKPRLLRLWLAAKLAITKPHSVERFLALTRDPLWKWEELAVTAKRFQAEVRRAPRSLGQKRSWESEQLMFVTLGKMSMLNIRGVLRSTARRL